VVLLQKKETEYSTRTVQRQRSGKLGDLHTFSYTIHKPFMLLTLA